MARHGTRVATENLVSYAHIERLIRCIAVRRCMIGLLWVSHGRARLK